MTNRTKFYLYIGPFRIRVTRWLFAHTSRPGVTRGGRA